MSSRGVSFVPGQPPRALHTPEPDLFLAKPSLDFVPPVPIVGSTGGGPRRVWSRGLKQLLLVAFLSMVTATILTVVALVDVVQGAVLARTALTVAQESGEELDLPMVRTALTDAQSGLLRMERGLSRLSYLKIVPGLGDQLEAGGRATSAASHTVSVLLDGFVVAEDIFASVDGLSGVLVTGAGDVRPYADLSTLEKERLLWALSNASGALRSMEVRLRLAQDDLARLDALNAHPRITEAVLPLQSMLPELVATVEVLQPLAAIAPEFAGLNTDQRLLVAYLDDGALRPGGGVVAIVGQLLIRDGEIVSFAATDVQTLDSSALFAGYTATVPDVLREYHDVSSWLIADSAWSAHMPETARVVTALTRQEMAFLGLTPPQVDGVIAVTPAFFERLFLLVGSVQIDGVTYARQDLPDLLALSLEDPAVLQTLFLALTDRLFALSPSRWSDGFSLMHEAFAAKELAVVSSDAATQSTFDLQNWSGSLVAHQFQDTLLVVDANVSTVSDALIDRSIEYSLTPHGEGYRATVRVTYDHTGGLNDAAYRNYVQLYVPEGSRLISASGFLAGDAIENPQALAAPVVLGVDRGFATFGGFFAVEPGDMHAVTFEYDLAPGVIEAISRGDYQLTALKQMGSGETLLTLHLDFGTTVATATPGEAAAEYFNTSYVVDAVLTQDQHFRVRLKR
ncbi:DUF4012 domain-containing protein [Patescibacteria group bacterium]|nr:DUF4012 domain-containing protein [Patescibacteria group bacterium]